MAEQQEGKAKKQRRIYSTQLINQLIQDRNQGYDIDFEPFFMRDLDLRAANIPFKMSEEELEEYQKCYDDPVYYAENYAKFMTDHGLSTVNLRDYQRNVISTVTLEEYDEADDLVLPVNRNIVWMSARQSGKTTTIAVFLSWMLIFHIDRNILIVANKEKTAIEIVDKIINIFKGLPFWLKPGTEQWGKTALKLDNGSKILSSATTNTASIGFTIHCVLLDEFAHIPDNIVNNFWRSVYPTLSSSRVSQCIITSTPNGTTNKFYEIVSGAIEKKNSFRYIRTDYWEVPGHDDAWAAQMKADFGEEEFAQEFELQFNKNSKMLMKSEDMNFTDRLVKQYVHKTIYVNNQYVNDEHITWHPDFDPNNIDENDIFVFLVDIAEGNGDPDERFQTKEKTPDANTINIFKVVLNSPSNIKRYSNLSCRTQDCIRFVQIGKYKNSSEDEIQAARVCSALSYNLFKDHERNNVRVMVEMNFNGKSFFEEFKRHQLYTGSTVLKTYHKKPIPGEQQKRKYGFKTTTNKEHYCIKGNKLISMHRTIVTCVDTFEQMKSFGYVRGKIKGIACHDDLSMPVFNHIPRMLDEKTFISWIDEYIQFKAERTKVYIINSIIQKWAMDNPEMSDDDFAGLYNLDENDSHVQPENNYIDFAQVTYGQTIGGGFNYGGGWFRSSEVGNVELTTAGGVIPGKSKIIGSDAGSMYQKPKGYANTYVYFCKEGDDKVILRPVQYQQTADLGWNPIVVLKGEHYNTTTGVKDYEYVAILHCHQTTSSSSYTLTRTAVNQ